MTPDDKLKFLSRFLKILEDIDVENNQFLNDIANRNDVMIANQSVLKKSFFLWNSTDIPWTLYFGILIKSPKYVDISIHSQITNSSFSYAIDLDLIKFYTDCEDANLTILTHGRHEFLFENRNDVILKFVNKIIGEIENEIIGI